MLHSLFWPPKKNSTTLPSFSPHSPSCRGQEPENSPLWTSYFPQHGCQPISSRRKTEVFLFCFVSLRFEANLYTFYTLIGILRKEMMRTGGRHMPCLWEPGRQSTRPITGAGIGLRSTHPPQRPSLATCGRVFTFHTHSAWKKDESHA